MAIRFVTKPGLYFCTTANTGRPGECINALEIVEVLQHCREQFGNEGRLKSRWAYQATEIHTTPIRMAKKRLIYDPQPFQPVLHTLTIQFFHATDAVMFKLRWSENMVDADYV